MIRFDGALVIPVLWLTSFVTWAVTADHTWIALPAGALLVALLWAGSRE